MIKRTFRRYVFIAIAALAIWSCGEDDRGQEKPQSPFFDLKSYFQGEIERLQAAQPRVRKTAVIGGQQEEQTLDQLNYQDELKVFLDSDINRTSWWDRYRIDTILLNNGQLSGINYTALSDKLKTRSVALQFSNGQVSSIHIENQTKSPAVAFFQELRFAPQKGYSIFTRQKVALSNPEEMRIEVVFE